MKRILCALTLAALLSACSLSPTGTAAAYLRGQSSVLSETDGAAVCALALRNPSGKRLECSLYGVFGGEQTLALNENGEMLSVTLAPYEQQTVTARFPSRYGLPDDIVIIGEYNK